MGKKDKKVKFNKKHILKILLVGLVVSLMVIFGVKLYKNYQLSKASTMSFKEALVTTTRNDKNAVITVGTIKNEKIDYTVYGKDGKILPKKTHVYEIGSLTKTFTAALVAKAISEGKIDLKASIADYLDLPRDKTYPSIEELLTHTSGYKAHYIEGPMIVNMLSGQNPFYDISDEMLQKKVADITLSADDYNFSYSNFGFAVLGQILEKVYGQDYQSLLNDFSQTELGLTHTKISKQDGDLGHYWKWKSDDAYLSAGAVTSDIVDMLSYAKMQLDGEKYFLESHRSLKKIDVNSEQYQKMGIRLDEIGMAWFIDKDKKIIWHNGGTSHYNAYLGFNTKTNTAVVVLSNLAPEKRISATILGIKKLNELSE